MSNNRMSNNRMITGIVTMQHLSVNSPRPSIFGGRDKYGACIIVSKSETQTIETIKASIKAAYEAGKGTLQSGTSIVPPLDTLKTPLRDGDVEHPGDAMYANSYFLNAYSIKKPGVFDADAKPINDPSEIHNGIEGLADITFYAFNTNGNIGIACGLNGIQKLSDGTYNTPPCGFKPVTNNMDFLN